MRDDHFDPQHIDEQIDQCLGDSQEQEDVAVKVIHDLQQKYRPGDHQEALQRVWQRIAGHQAAVSSTGSAEAAEHRSQQQWRKHLMQPSSPTRKKIPHIAALVGIAASLLIVGSLLAVIILLHPQPGSRPPRPDQVTPARTSVQVTPVPTSIYTHTEDANHQVAGLSWSPDSHRLFVNQQVMTVTYGSPYEAEAWDALTGQNYHKYTGDTVNIWSGRSIHWSPNGKYIAYLSSPDASPKGIGGHIHARIVVLDASNSQVLHTSDLLPIGPASSGIPEANWSSDNATISFVNRDNVNAFVITSWNMLTGKLINRPITNGSSVQANESSFFGEYWSPDGKYIIFNTNPGNAGEVLLFIVDAQSAQFIGSYTTTFPRDSLLFLAPLLGWTTDSSLFFFYTTTQNAGLRVVGIAPTGQTVSDTILPGITSYSFAWLSPDGKYLASYNDRIHVINIWSLAAKKIITHYQSAGPAFAWSPDEHFVAIAYTAREEKITTRKIDLPQ